jgi:hypothetical protein
MRPPSCAWAAIIGHATATLPKSVMNSRRFIGFARAEGYAGQLKE